MRLIDADALIADCELYSAWDAQIVKGWLDDQPTIDIVRCGECIHLTNDRICPRWERICEITGGGKAENGYCDEGIRRADDE